MKLITKWKVGWYEDGDWYEDIFFGYEEAERFFENKCDKLIESTGIRPAHCSIVEVT